MGYTTQFKGEFSVTPQLSEEHNEYLAAFAEIRHMQRDPSKLQNVPDPIREAAGLELGKFGEFFIGDLNEGYCSYPDTIIDQNYSQDPDYNNRVPGLWCQWVPGKAGNIIEWDENEKFYDYIEWLNFLIDNLLKPWGYTINGTVLWQGEEVGDVGKIIVENNVVSTQTFSINE